MRKLVITVTAVMAISGVAVSSAGAAPNPYGTGQPGAFVTNGSGTSLTACGVDNRSIGGVDATLQPHGLTTDGFATAAGVYANPGTTSGAANAVSEYDIACYQFTTNH